MAECGPIASGMAQLYRSEGIVEFAVARRMSVAFEARRSRHAWRSAPRGVVGSHSHRDDLWRARWHVGGVRVGDCVARARRRAGTRCDAASSAVPRAPRGVRVHGVAVSTGYAAPCGCRMVLRCCSCSCTLLVSARPGFEPRVCGGGLPLRVPHPQRLRHTVCAAVLEPLLLLMLARLLICSLHAAPQRANLSWLAWRPGRLGRRVRCRVGCDEA